MPPPNGLEYSPKIATDQEISVLTLHRTYYSGIERGVRNVSIEYREGGEGIEEEPAGAVSVGFNTPQVGVEPGLHSLNDGSKWLLRYLLATDIQSLGQRLV
jgi:hypothetical protein